MKDWDSIQNWFKETYEKSLDGVTKFAEKVQKQIEEYAFDENKKKEYKEGVNTIGEGFQAIFKGLTVLATSTAKTVSEWIVPKEKKSSSNEKTTTEKTATTSTTGTGAKKTNTSSGTKK